MLSAIASFLGKLLKELLPTLITEFKKPKEVKVVGGDVDLQEAVEECIKQESIPSSDGYKVLDSFTGEITLITLGKTHAVFTIKYLDGSAEILEAYPPTSSSLTMYNAPKIGASVEVIKDRGISIADSDGLKFIWKFKKD